MKYWRGYLVALIFSAMALALANFAQSHTELIDMVYPYITRLIQSYLVEWSSGVGFCVWQLLLSVGTVLVLAVIVMMIVARWNPVQCIGWMAAVFSIVFFLHTGLYSLNYHAGLLGYHFPEHDRSYDSLRQKSRKLQRRSKILHP